MIFAIRHWWWRGRRPMPQQFIIHGAFDTTYQESAYKSAVAAWREMEPRRCVTGGAALPAKEDDPNG